MRSDNSTTYGFCSNSHCMCHTSMVPCLGTSPPVTQYWYNNVPLSSPTFPKYQSPPDNTMYGFSDVSNPVTVNPPLFHVGKQEAAGDQQMATNEIDSWLPLPPNLYNNNINKVDGSMNLASYCSLTGNQDHGQFDQMLLNYNSQSCKEQLNFSQNDYSTSPSIFYTVASLQSTGAGIIPETTIGTTNLPQEWAHNPLEFSPFSHGNLVQEAVGSHSSSTRTSSLGTQQLASKDDLKGPLSRQQRILRYFEKKKSRKYEKKIIYSSRKTYARTRPRIRGRFARSSQN